MSVVMRKIDDLLPLLGNFGSDNFVMSSYITDQNKVLPCYEMTRDGFMLIGMGFTGSAAIKWQISFIRAFNQMEEQLRMVHQLKTDHKPEALQYKIAEAKANDELIKIQQGALRRLIKHHLDIAEMMETSFDINQIIDAQNTSIPPEMVLEMKMAMGKEISAYSSLALERSSVSHLLEVNNINMTAQAFNAEYLIPNGLLNKDKEVTVKGLYFGTNDKASSVCNTTHPRWFDDRFKEMLDYLKVKH
ncbi:hypothetical protein AB832_05050 [Flavobacteriaceae bacterium (ex Bugula neritina AB1)]|nr:hypothetical protein AB832_05050 [Flavobacteriaceae bacterium (ex Bugula neritina AB1)]